MDGKTQYGCGKLSKILPMKLKSWLVNTVRAQAAQAGIDCPEVAIYDAQDMNAFATGMNKNKALVAVSSGLLNNMTRDEAEAVLAHEVSHVANGDMVTLALIQGVVNTFVIFIARIVGGIIDNFISGNNDEESSGHGFSYFIIVFILEMIFGVLASTIVMYYSRKREFSADSGAASLVGKEKMIAALQRLQQGSEPKLEGSLMAFGISGKRSGGLFMSHPPLESRIAALQAMQS